MARRLSTLVAIAVVALASLLPLASEAAASSGPATVVVLDSEAGEYYGQGRAHTFVDPDTVTASGSLSGLQVYVSNGTWEHRIDLAAPGGQDLVVGPYEGATWNTDGTPHLSVTLGSSGCSNSSGRFDVLEAPVVGDNSQITTFAADFEFRCGDSTRTLYGQIRINSTVPIKALDLDVPSDDAIDMGAGTVMVPAAPRPVTVTNVGNVPATLDGITVGGTNPASVLADLGTCPATLDPGASCALAITYRPERAGENIATVALASDSVRWGIRFWPHGTAVFASAANVSPATALSIGALPFGHGGTSPAVYEGSWNACPANYGSLWYRYATPTKRRVELDPAGSEGPVQVMVMTGTADSPPTTCNLGPVTFTAEANVTYWIRLQVAYPGSQGAGVVLQAREGAPDLAVEAGGFAVSTATFYPYVDGYRDTVAIKGNRFEKASVAIAIYSSTGSKVRAFSVAAAKGPWAVAWNGKTASGVKLAAGKYRIVQTVTDLWGNKLAGTSYVYLSLKRLYTYTWSKTVDAGAYNAYGKALTGSISRSASSYTGGVRLSTGTGGGAAAVGYVITIPTATVYKTVTFQVLGRGNLVAGAAAETGFQDWTMCTSWSVNCVDRWGATPVSYGWAGIRVTGSHHVTSTHRVRGYINVWTYGSGLARWIDARDVRFIVVYGILK